MKQTGKVISVDGMTATVEVSRKSACDMCHNNTGACSACFTFGEKQAVTRARNDANAARGDTVTLETASGKVLAYSAALFFAPTLLSIAAYLAAARLGISAPVSAIATFAATFAVAAVICERTARRGYDVIVESVISRSDTDDMKEDIRKKDED